MLPSVRSRMNELQIEHIHTYGSHKQHDDVGKQHKVCHSIHTTTAYIHSSSNYSASFVSNEQLTSHENAVTAQESFSKNYMNATLHD